MQVVENHNFKNEATRRFHDYLYSIVKSGKDGRDRVYDALGLTGTNPSTFFSHMRNGNRSVTMDQIYIAREKFGLNPGYLFETSDQEQLGFSSMMVEEDAVEYVTNNNDVQKFIGNKVDGILKKHKVKIEPFANKRLDISKQAMYDKLKGKTRMFFDEVLLICEDTGESLEQFRRTPMPKGHHLQQMELMSQMIELLTKENNDLKKQLKKK